MIWQTVELREIRTFLACAQELHFGRAAERLGVTPSRVSQTIRTLETRAGGRLFDRSSRRVALTPLGEQLRDGAGPAYHQLEEAFTAITRDPTDVVSGTLRLGMYSPVSGGPHLVELIRTFEARHPACRVAVSDTGFARPQLDWLRSGELDMLAMRLPIHDPDITIGPLLAHEDRVLAVAVDHPLARRESVCLEDIADYRVADPVTLPREMMNAFIPPRTSSGRPLRRFPVQTIDESLVRTALGETVHLTVRSFLKYSRHPGLASIPIQDLPPSQTALIWLTTGRSPKIDALAQATGELFTPDANAGGQDLR